MTPKISIIIPSFNKARFIAKTLDSIVSQKYSNLEVIIQDGGSSDGTPDIIKKYAAKYPKTIRWESKKDKGQLDAINKGLNKVSGEILAFINADDVYEPNAFASVAAAYQKNLTALWFAGRGIVIDEKDREIAKLITRYKNLFLAINHKSLLLILNYLMQPSVFITRRAYETYGPFTGTPDFVTEYDLWLKLARIQMPSVINKNLSKFRIEPGTKTKQMSVKLLKEDEKIVKKHTRNIPVLALHKLHNIIRLLIGRNI